MGRNKKYATEEERLAARRAAREAWAARNPHYHSQYVSENREAINAKNAQYRAANPDKNRAWQARYRENNPEKFKQSQREHKRRKYWSDPDYRLQMQLRSRLCKTLGRGSDVTAAIAKCGCSFQELRHHLEAQFEPGMSWDSRSEWHVDHIYPLAGIDPKNRRHVAAACNWRNLRPVWAAHNRAKSDVITPESQALFDLILSELTPENENHAAAI
jgi:hypothetical protein